VLADAVAATDAGGTPDGDADGDAEGVGAADDSAAWSKARTDASRVGVSCEVAAAA
jgi:hypothetical protein